MCHLENGVQPEVFGTVIMSDALREAGAGEEAG